MMEKKTIAVLFLILIFNLGGLSHLTPANSSCFKFDMSEVKWSSLSFESGNFFYTVTTKTVLEETAADEIEDKLIASPQGVVLKPSGAKVLIVTTNSTVSSLFGSDELLVTRLWFNPQDATALQRIRVRTGKEKWEKTYRWTETGVYRKRIQPNSADEKDLPVGRWTNIENSFYPYDLTQCKCGSISGPPALLYVVSAAGLAAGDQPLQLCVFNKKQLHLVRIRAEKYQLLKINYLEKSQHKTTQRKEKIEVLKVSFTSRSLFADEAKAEPFSFLGLKGDFDLYIDKKQKIPVQVSGKISGLGEVDFQLVKVKLN